MGRGRDRAVAVDTKSPDVSPSTGNRHGLQTNGPIEPEAAFMNLDYRILSLETVNRPNTMLVETYFSLIVYR
jgi:hypothetical protein